MHEDIIGLAKGRSRGAKQKMAQKGLAVQVVMGLRL